MGKTMREFRDEVTKGILLESAGGVLPPEAAAQFFGAVETNSLLLANATRLTVTRPQQELHHLSAAARQLRKVVPGTADTPGTITPKERVINPSRASLAIDVDFDWLDGNADGRDADTVMQNYLAQLVAADLADLAANGDGTTSGFLAIAEGWLKLVTDNDDSDINNYTATNATMLGAAGVLAKVRNAQPTQYRKPGSLIIMNTAEADQFVDELGARATTLGDEAIKNGGPYPWQGYKIIPSSTWPVDHVLMTPADNLIYGVWKDISIVKEVNLRKHQVEYTLELRVGFQFAVGAAVTIGLTA